MPPRKPYRSDVCDEAWQFVAPYLTLVPLDAVQRTSRAARGLQRSALDRGDSVEMAFVDQGYSGVPASQAARSAGIVRVVKHTQATQGFVVLPKRLVRDYERLSASLIGMHFIAFAGLTLRQAMQINGLGT